MTKAIQEDSNFFNILAAHELGNIGNEMYCWATALFPICRSITGEGVRQTLSYIKALLPDLTVHTVPSGTQAFDWVVPNEWTIRSAYIQDPTGRRIVDMEDNNLHVVSYSRPVDQYISKQELEKHLHSIVDLPNAIPYVTSYYTVGWGFCLSDHQRRTLVDGMYRVVIDSDLKPGVLNYGELVIPGEVKDEILFSTYVCHPSMANNELSGPVVVSALAQWLLKQPRRRYTYRIIFLPETIGSIVYLSKNLQHLKKNLLAGFNITCAGDERCYSYLESRNGNTVADNVAAYALQHYVGEYRRYSYLERGSDERQYCSPLVDLPVVSLMRSKYGTFPEYHTSLDNLSLISAKGLSGSLNLIIHCLYILENNHTYTVTTPCEPQLGKRGLYPSLGTRGTREQVMAMMNILAYSDGSKSLLEVAKLIDVDFIKCVEIVRKLFGCGVIKKCNPM